MKTFSQRWETVELSFDGSVGRITLQRPEVRNALNFAMWLDLKAALERVEANPNVTVVILTGAGSAFCAGADLKARREGARQGRSAAPTVALIMALVADVCLAMERLRPLLITRLNGPAVGAGFGLAISGDLVIACRSASLRPGFAVNAVTPDAGSSWRLPRLVGMSRAMQMVLFDELMSAEEAARAGLVDEVVDDDQLDATIDEKLHRLNGLPPEVVPATVALLRGSRRRTFAEAIQAETRATVAMAQLGDQAACTGHDGRRPDSAANS